MSDRTPAPSAVEPVEDLLRRVPFFRDLDRIEAARLVGALEKAYFTAGTLIFSEGAEADSLFLLEAGKVQVSVAAEGGERSVAVLEAPGYFGELGLLLARRTGSVRALTDVETWTLPRHRFNQVVRERGAVGVAVAASLARLIEDRSREHAGGTAVARAPAAPAAAPEAAWPRPWRIAAAAAPVLLPLALWLVPPPAGLTTRGWHVGLIVLGAALGWLLQPVPDFVIGLAMTTAWGLTGLVPITLAFAGFASPTWVLAFGAIGLAAAMARSGLLFRFALLLLRTLPATHTGQLFALLIGGVLTTPLVPAVNARISSASGLAREVAQALGYGERSRASAGLAFAGFIGNSTFSSVFLTGLATNFFLLGLLPAAERARADWLSWLADAAPVGLLVFVGALAALLFFFRPERASTIAPEALRRQRRVLGALSKHEIVTIVAVAVFLAGMLLEPVLRIDPAWLATTALVIVLAGGVLDSATFRSGIQWGFLILFGLLVGSGAVFRTVGIDRWIARELAPLVYLAGQPAVLVAVLGALIAACRLVLPRVPANFLLILALLPVAPQLRLSPWLVGFIVLTVGNTWLFPGLSDFYIVMRENTRGEMFTDRDGLRVGVLVTMLVLMAITAAVPYWRAIGLITR
ncbi:MAG TPA: SLC13 family permease [bacterium]|nr:SLC13 family permease [bacterium]